MSATSKTYHIAWNEARTVGVICEDPQMAYELRKGASNCLGIVTGDFCEAWGDMTANDACTIETVTMAKVSDLASKSFPSVLGGTALGLIDEDRITEPALVLSRKCVICNGAGECTGPRRTCGACNGSGVMR